MFCPECGTKNEDGAKFCENCGTRLTVEENIAQTQATVSNSMNTTQVQPAVNESTAQTQRVANNSVPTKTTKPMSKGVKIGIVAAIVVIIVGVVLNNKFKKDTSPETVAKEYFEDVAAANWEDVYGYYDLTESNFINKKMYAKAVKNKDKIEYTNFEVKNNDMESIEDIFNADVEEDSKKNEGMNKTIVIQYAEKGNTNQIYTVNLVKQQKKKFLFYDNWKVVPQEMVVKNYTIRTLRDFKVEVDGIKIDKSYIRKDDSSSESDYEEDDEFVTYEIPTIFGGTHNIKISGEFIETHEDTITCDAYNSTMYRFTEAEVKKDFTKDIEENLDKAISKIYEAALDNKEFKDLDIGFEFISEEDNEDEHENLVENYDRLVKNLDDLAYFGEIVASKLELKDFEIDNDSVYLNNGRPRAQYDYRVNYTGEFTKKNGDKKETKSKDGETRGELDFEYIDGKWTITRMYLNSLYVYF